MERYYDVLKQLYTSALEFIEKVQGKNLDITVDMRAGLEIMAFRPLWFSADGKDYRAYYAFLRVYHALIRYYKYSAVYNRKDKELEDALNNWYNVSQPKQNVFSALINKLNQKRVK